MKPDQDQEDFFKAMRFNDALIAPFVRSKINAGRSPQEITTLLQYLANQAAGWCIGRYRHH